MQKNKDFLRKLFTGEPVDRHAFICNPQFMPETYAKKWGVREAPPRSYTLRSEPVTTWVPSIAARYEWLKDFHASIEDDGVPCASLMTGTHIYAAAFGCPVHEYENSNPAALPLVQTADEADALDEPSIESSRVLERIFELGHALLEELGPEINLAPPDFQSGFDIAAQIWQKESFFMALMDPNQQASIQRLVDRCSSLLRKMYRRLRSEFPTMTPCHCPGAAWVPPELGPWLSNDECGALNTTLFEQFCLPELIGIAEAFGGLGMHCCAGAEHQFPSFKKIPNFYAFNRVPAQKGIWPILDHFAGPGSPVHVLAWLDDSTMIELMARAPEGTRFVFVRAVNSMDEAKAWLDRMIDACAV
ncbi:MAG: hypothetical protein D6820_11200 [Lentisphaerae bacterium]|nr:MAG: hypothetical protein D6820_11200 [Lentisphaerota bacterium]